MKKKLKTKKELRKLVLRKETLRNLGQSELEVVLGGVITYTSCGERCKNNSYNSQC